MLRDDKANRYKAILARIFLARFTGEQRIVPFERPDLVTANSELGFPSIKNLGDIIYSYRFRGVVPDEIAATAPDGLEWSLEIVGRANYAFRLFPRVDLSPRAGRAPVLVPDSTPEIIRAYRLGDEQARLATIRYNRLIDLFLGMNTWSAQNHLRTTLQNGAQIEIDELYLGLDAAGTRYAIPVQAKGGLDMLSPVQARQDIDWCIQSMPDARCRSISAYFVSDHEVIMFELEMRSDRAIEILSEARFKLVSQDEFRPDRPASKRKKP